MIELLQERIYKINEFREINQEDLKFLRNEISKRIDWFLTTENYNKNKVNKLLCNEKKINRVIIERI